MACDILRFWWGLLYWNTRKSYFRWRRGAVRCPCQNPAIQVAPGDRLRCGERLAPAGSIPSRLPFVWWRHPPDCVARWTGRTCGHSGGEPRRITLAGCRNLPGGCPWAFVFFRVIGYPLSPLSLAWPPRWHEVASRPQRIFSGQSQTSAGCEPHQRSHPFARSCLPEQSSQLRGGLQFAQLTSPGQPELADPVLPSHARSPGRRATTGEAWFRFLLVRGRFARIAALASARLREDAQQRPVWLHACSSPPATPAMTSLSARSSPSHQLASSRSMSR